MSGLCRPLPTIWHCQCHVVWVRKYRVRVLVAAVKEAAGVGIHAICGFVGCDVVKLNVQRNHVHLVVMIPPKVSVSNLVGRLKGVTSMKLFNQFRRMRKEPYWGNHFWSKGYCVDTLRLDADVTWKYVQYHEKKENQLEQLQLY
jgi:putative transposase